MRINNPTKVLELTHWWMSTHIPWCGKIKRVNSSFLAKKYVRKFRSNPKIPMSSFMETMKENCMYEISKYQFYWTRSKCAKVINGIVAE